MTVGWLSGNDGLDQRQAGLVLEWVTSAGSIRVRTVLVASHPGQLSLAIHPWIDAVSTRESWRVNRHTIQCTLKVLPKPHGPLGLR